MNGNLRQETTRQEQISHIQSIRTCVAALQPRAEKVLQGRRHVQQPDNLRCDASGTQLDARNRWRRMRKRKSILGKPEACPSPGTICGRWVQWLSFPRSARKRPWQVRCGAVTQSRGGEPAPCDQCDASSSNAP
jgi:hypothetical protein